MRACREYEGDKLIYDGSPEIMAAYADRVHRHGVALIGGCCGSGPEHVAMMRQVLDGAIPVPEVDLVTPISAASEPAATRSRERRMRRGE